MRVLGIESSCDETGIAIYDSEHGLMADVLHSQVSTHKGYGGVVPELASRDHIKYLVPLMDAVLGKANICKTTINAIAYTAGPGLTGALLTGACFAKSLAFSLEVPALAVHHLEAHFLAAKLDYPDLDFPFLVLLVSGGHTQLIEARALGSYQVLGDTLDDAVGEAFDKTAKLMGFPYPGGKQLASIADEQIGTDTHQIPPFPRPMTTKPGLDFSFSGLKTHAITTWNNSKKDDDSRKSIAFAFQQAVVETLSIKCKRAVLATKIKKLVVAGGVSANLSLRIALSKLMRNMAGEAYFPQPAYCSDNGAMVAYAGYLHLLQGNFDKDQTIEVRARWSLEDLDSFESHAFYPVVKNLGKEA